jgi:ABC-type transporter Mla MlaB component
MTGDCAVYDDGVLRITTTDDPPGLAIAGEIDESTYPGLVSALDKLADGPAEIHVSLAAVSYCDLAGLRAIVRITGADSNGTDGSGNGGSRRVVLHGVPRQLKTVLQIVGWDSIPGLALDQPDRRVQPGSAGRSGGHGQESVIW